MNLGLLHQIDMRSNYYIDWMEYHAEWINIWKNKHNDVLAGQWVEGIVTHTPVYMEWYRKNTTLFLSVAQQLHDHTQQLPKMLQGQVLNKHILKFHILSQCILLLHLFIKLLATLASQSPQPPMNG